MMRSLSSGVAGLRTHQTKMDVIGNNIANVNTFGFKSSRATFADVYYQNLSGGRAAGTQTGGMNPTQIGYGSAVATIDIMQGVAGNSSTDRAMDVYIAGDGFLVSKDASGAFKYTRLGNLGFDAAGNLVDSNGNYVQGFPMNPDGTPNINEDGRTTGDALQGIRVDPAILDKLTGISISTSGAIIGMLPGDTVLTMSSTNENWINNDITTLPQTSNYRGDITLAVSGYANANTFNAELSSVVPSWAGLVKNVEIGNIALPAGGYTISVVDGLVKMTIPANTTAGEPAIELTGKLDKNGQVVLKKTGSTNDIGLTLTIDTDRLATLTPPNQLPNVETRIQLDLCAQVTTYDKGGNLKKLYPNGRTEPAPIPAGATTVQFGEITLGLNSDPPRSFNQKIGRADAEEASSLVLGNLVLAKFRNSQALLQSGTSAYEATANSGEAEYTLPGLEGTGALSAGYLEMSNVDLSKEFTEMITTQRGFQANSRIITVSDTMLEELVNLKR